MFALLFFLQSSVHALPAPGTLRPEGHIYRRPWWEREVTPFPPEATTPPTEQPYTLGEFDPVEGVLLTNWYFDWVSTYTAMIDATLARGVSVYLCDEPGYRSIAESQLSAAGIDATAINWLDCTLETVWMRDYGPMFTVNEDAVLRIGDAAYAGRPYDDSFPGQATRWWGEDFYDVPLYMEGGNFFADGNGTCVSTNIVFAWYASDFPWITEEYASDVYRSRLGCDETIWLEPLVGEGTGHVDMFFTFIDKDNVIVGSYTPEEDVFGVNTELLDRNAERLADAGYVVHRVPMLPNRDADGDSWEDFHTVINGFFVNKVDGPKAFLAPTYRATYPGKTNAALAAMREAMPDVEVVGIPAENLITYGGALHCVVKTIPIEAWPNPCDDAYAFNDDDPRCDTEALPDGGDGGPTDGENGNIDDRSNADTTGGGTDTGDSNDNGDDPSSLDTEDGGTENEITEESLSDEDSNEEPKKGCSNLPSTIPSKLCWLAPGLMALFRRREPKPARKGLSQKLG